MTSFEITYITLKRNKLKDVLLILVKTEAKGPKSRKDCGLLWSQDTQ